MGASIIRFEDKYTKGFVFMFVHDEVVALRESGSNSIGIYISQREA